MGKRIEALVKPELLSWARKTAGFELTQAAKKAQVSVDRLEAWESGQSRPTMTQLRKLGRLYRRPIALFYLPEPPDDVQEMHDFRRLPGKVAGVQSPELRFEVRRAQSRRESALDLYSVVGGSPPQFSLGASQSHDPEQVGTAIRESIGVRHEDQVRWAPGYGAFNEWRAALENSGVLVFQATDVAVSEVRGFSISETPLPAIVVNIKDSPRGRTFSMLHELCHIMLHKGGLCDLYEDTERPQEEQRVEVFCNHVAGAALVPQEHLLEEDLVRRKRHTAEWLDEELGELAARYGVSREVLLRRLLICGRTTEAFYRQKREQFQLEYEAQAKPVTGGFAPPDRVAISSAGPAFVRLVLSNYYQDHITASDVSDLLEVRLKHLAKIETAIFGKTVKAGDVA